MQDQKASQFKYQHTCLNTVCQKKYGTKSKASKTCSERCRQALSRSKKQTQDTTRLYKFSTSPFAHSIARQCIRAGTVQVVLKDAELLAELHAIFKLAGVADGYGATKNYAIAHLSPVKGQHSIGTLHPKNLVVSDRAINSKHSNTLPGSGIGHSILRCNLEPRWQVNPDSTPAAVIQKLVQFLGESFCAALTAKLDLKPATREKYLSQLAPHLGHETVKAAGSLDDLTTPQLGKLVSLVTGKSSGSFSPDAYGLNPGEVFMVEAKRLSKYYPHLEQAHADYLTVHTQFLNDSWDARFSGEHPTSQVDRLTGRPYPQSVADVEDAKTRLASRVQWMFDVFHKATPLEGSKHAVDTKLSHSFQEPLPVDSSSPCLVTQPECSAFTHADYAELEELECRERCSLLTEADTELDTAFMGQRSKTQQQSAWQRFIAA